MVMRAMREREQAVSPMASSTSSARFARRFVQGSRRRNYNNQTAMRKRQVAEQQRALVEQTSAAAAAATATAGSGQEAATEQFVTEQKYVCDYLLVCSLSF